MSCECVNREFGLVWVLVMKEQLITMDILALETMKNAAKCDR